MVFRERKAMALILGVGVLVALVIKAFGVEMFYAIPMGLSLITLFGFGIYQLLVNGDVEE